MRTTSSVKHDKGNIIAWACASATETGSRVFIDDVTSAGSGWVNSEVHWSLSSDFNILQNSDEGASWSKWIMTSNELQTNPRSSQGIKHVAQSSPHFNPTELEVTEDIPKGGKTYKQRWLPQLAYAVSPILDLTQLYFEFLWIWLC